MEKHYECVVETSENILTVNVFTESEDKQVIKELAIERAVEFQEQLGITLDIEKIKPIGYKIVKKFTGR